MAGMMPGSAARELVALSDARPATNSCKTKQVCSGLCPTNSLLLRQASCSENDRKCIGREGTRSDIMADERTNGAHTSRNVLASSEVAKRG